MKRVLTSATQSWQCLDFVLVIALNYAVITQVKNGCWHPPTHWYSRRSRGGNVCLSWWMSWISPSVHSEEMTFPGSAGLRSRLLLLLDETFVGRSLQASFTEAAGNNIVAAFGCVRSHISGCSIRNRPQCRTINPWPQQQICAVTTQHGTINQT